MMVSVWSVSKQITPQRNLSSGRYLLRKGSKPIVQKDFLKLRSRKHFEEDEIFRPCVLYVVGGHRRHEPVMIGIEVYGPRILLRTEDAHASLTLNRVLPFAHVRVPMHLPRSARLLANDTGCDL